MSDKKLNYYEAISMSMLVMITHIILNLPNNIIKEQGSASIINVLFITIIALLLFLLTYKLLTPFEDKDILEISEFVGGKFLRYLLTILYSIYLIFVSSTLMENFCETLKIIYFPNSAIWTIIAIFIIVVTIAHKTGFENVVKVITLLMPIICLSIIVLFISSINNFNYHRIFPILGNGFKTTFITGASNIYVYSLFICLFLFKTDIQKQEHYKKIGILSILLSGVYLLLSISSLLFSFPSLVSGQEILSLFANARTIEYGSFLQRVDALYIFIWIFTFIAYLSVIFYLLVKVNKSSFNIKNNSILLYIIGFAIFISALVFNNFKQISILKDIFYKYMSLGIILGFSFIILIIGYFKKSRFKVKIAQQI